MSADNDNMDTKTTETKEIVPLETLYDATLGVEIPLPSELERFYGALRFPLRTEGPYVIANLVTSLDGVVSLGIPGKAGGKEISGSNQPDLMLMGLLRAVADAVVEGAGTLREGKGKPLTASGIYPPLAGAYASLRAALGKEGEPLAVIVTASGDLDPSMQIFNGGSQVLVVTTSRGARHARKLGLPAEVEVAEVEVEGPIPAAAVLDALAKVRNCAVVLVEGGPHLLGDFLGENLIDEQFLTLAPQIVGRDTSGTRLGLVEGRTFAPEHPLWSRLAVVKRSDSHLFLRYAFDTNEESPT
jgi:riboflavin biosynthesis pyrimidine reductase